MTITRGPITSQVTITMNEDSNLETTDSAPFHTFSNCVPNRREKLEGIGGAGANKSLAHTKQDGNKGKSTPRDQSRISVRKTHQSAHTLTQNECHWQDLRRLSHNLLAKCPNCSQSSSNTQSGVLYGATKSLCAVPYEPCCDNWRTIPQKEASSLELGDLCVVTGALQGVRTLAGWESVGVPTSIAYCFVYSILHCYKLCWCCRWSVFQILVLWHVWCELGGADDFVW